jgi:hypothetical protein
LKSMFFSPEQRTPLLSLPIYAAAIAFTGLVTALGAQRVAVAVMDQVAAQPSPAKHAQAQPVKVVHAAAAVPQPAPRPQSLRRDAQLVPTADRWDGWERPRRRGGYPGFGSSSRGMNPFYERGWGDDNDDDDRRLRTSEGTYRTLCVRTCDGYYFPISFATTRESFAKDSRTCESKCGGKARLFVHRNPGGDAENMEDLQGRPYRQLPTAFLYRTSYVADCKCQPDPWEEEAKLRHRVYALTVARNKGDKQAARELPEVEAKVRAAAAARIEKGKLAALPEPAQTPAVANRGPSEVLRRPEFVGREGERAMRLGRDEAPRPRQAPSPYWSSERGSDAWQRRAFRLDW